ncbi:hypothetical protein ACIRLA_33680 [Streptomyces sp. NPDC102364]|uniref:hypothetical protein n=1 Tax=Streptomyces sp. NPDC102364 TaxID=3366161 RepID=UPI0037FBA1BB
MPEHRPGRALAAEAPERTAVPTTARRLRLSRLLAEMVPGARTLRVSLRGPARTWPSPHASAYDETGRRLPLNPPQARTAARWIIRACAEVDWRQEHDLDLRTGGLLRVTETRNAAVGGR